MVAMWVVVRLESEDQIGYARLPVNIGTARSGNALAAPSELGSTGERIWMGYRHKRRRTERFNWTEYRNRPAKVDDPRPQLLVRKVTATNRKIDTYRT